MPRSSSPRPARRRPDPGGKPGAGRPPQPVHQRDLLHICGLTAVEALFARDPGRVERLFFEERLAADLTPARQALARGRKPYRKVDAAELARIAGTLHHLSLIHI